MLDKIKNNIELYKEKKHLKKVYKDKDADYFFDLASFYEYYLKNNKKAIYNYREAAKLGDSDAIFKLAKLLVETSDGNKAEALLWFEKLISSGDEKATEKFIEFYKKGLITVKQQEFINWLNIEAEKGNYYSMYTLVDIHREGIIVEKDSKKAFKLAKYFNDKNKELFNPILGCMYLSGEGTFPDKKKAFYHFKQGKDIGDITMVVSMMLDGTGTDKNKLEAFKYCIENGNLELYRTLFINNDSNLFKNFHSIDKEITNEGNLTMYSLEEVLLVKGIRYLIGDDKYRGIKQNFKEAFKCLLEAAKIGEVNAEFIVAAMYYDGIGIKEDKSVAYTWFDRAEKNKYIDKDLMKKLF